MKVAGVVIAGGRSLRMGANKSLIKIGSATILQRILDCLKQQTDIVALNSNLEDPYDLAALPVIPDIHQQVATPLAGIHAALRWAVERDCGWVLTVPSDTPFLPSDLTTRLLASATGTGASIAHSAGQSHYVTGLWSTDLASELESVLAQGTLYRVRDWALRAKAATAVWPVEGYDPFFNVNTPGDLAEARRLAEELGL